MTWLDGLLIFVFVVFLAAGARLGSLWTSACIAGGFVGAYLVDTYAVSVGGLWGGFWGAHLVAAILLYAAGAGAVLLFGWLLSRAAKGLFLGLVDGAFGLLTGGVAGLFFVTLVLLVLVPLAPRVERSRPWQHSLLVRPLHRTLESFFNGPRFWRSPGQQLKRELGRAVAPVERATEQKIRSASERVTDHLKP